MPHYLAWLMLVTFVVGSRPCSDGGFFTGFSKFNSPTLLTNTSYNSIGNPRATGFSVRLLSATFVKKSIFILFIIFIYLSRIFHLNPSKIPRDTRSDRNPQYLHTCDCKNGYLIGIHLCLKIMKIATKPSFVY